MQVLDTLIKAQELIRDPANWVQHTYCRDPWGQSVEIQDPNAKCFCTVGAIARVAGLDRAPDAWNHPAIKILNQAIGKNGDDGELYIFNDHHLTLHQDVMAAFDKARELAAAGT